MPERLQKYGHGMINPLKTLGAYDTYLNNLDSDDDGLLDFEELYIYHTFIALEETAVIFEIKEGPYVPADDKEFATFAPKENDPDVDQYMKKLLSTLTF